MLKARRLGFTASSPASFCRGVRGLGNGINGLRRPGPPNCDYAKALGLLERAAASARQIPALTVFGDILPPKHRRDAWTKVREPYLALREMQKLRFDKFPRHFRGEIMAGLAQAAERRGETETAIVLTRELGRRASRDALRCLWQKLAGQTRIACQNQGRLFQLPRCRTPPGGPGRRTAELTARG